MHHLIVSLTRTNSGLVTENDGDVDIFALSAASMFAESPAYYTIYLLPTRQATASVRSVAASEREYVSDGYPILLADETGCPQCPTTSTATPNAELTTQGTRLCRFK